MFAHLWPLRRSINRAAAARERKRDAAADDDAVAVVTPPRSSSLVTAERTSERDKRECNSLASTLSHTQTRRVNPLRAQNVYTSSTYTNV